MTDLQKKMMLKIAHSDWTVLNGAPPSKADETVTWADCVIESKSDGGVFTSLQKEGWVWINPGHDGTVGLTEEGFQAYLRIQADANPAN